MLRYIFQLLLSSRLFFLRFSFPLRSVSANTSLQSFLITISYSPFAVLFFTLSPSSFFPAIPPNYTPINHFFRSILLPLRYHRSPSHLSSFTLTYFYPSSVSLFSSSTHFFSSSVHLPFLFVSINLFPLSLHSLYHQTPLSYLFPFLFYNRSLFPSTSPIHPFLLPPPLSRAPPHLPPPTSHSGFP